MLARLEAASLQQEHIDVSVFVEQAMRQDGINEELLVKVGAPRCVSAAAA